MHGVITLQASYEIPKLMYVFARSQYACRRRPSKSALSLQFPYEHNSNLLQYIPCILYSECITQGIGEYNQR